MCICWLMEEILAVKRNRKKGGSIACQKLQKVKLAGMHNATGSTGVKNGADSGSREESFSKVGSSACFNSDGFQTEEVSKNKQATIKLLADQWKQVHHHNGDQTAWQPHILCSVSFHSFGALESCTIVHCITSQPANVSQYAPYWQFRQPRTGRPKYKRGLFDPPGLEGCGGRIWAHLTARGFLLAPLWHISSISYQFWFM